MKPKKKISPKRNEIIKRMAHDIRGGGARMDRFAVRLEDSTKCGVCSRDGRTMVRLTYENGDQDFLGKTCARYIMDLVNADQSFMN
ncbi:MAG: hypothetical protein GX825_03800 [Syntrophomonadaceae bacterium]|nr:hypothetical protein [Syntrophomonadaceae bacterium]